MKKILLIFFGLIFLALPVAAEEFQAEVMSVQGNVWMSSEEEERRLLREGDILNIGDLVETDKNSFVEIAYDSDWQNVTRIEPESRVLIKTLYPIALTMSYGDAFSNLNKLPKDSSFEVQTPTAVAAVRGSVYRTLCRAGTTQVYNFSPSPVSVFGVDAFGQPQVSSQAVLRNSQKVGVAGLGRFLGGPANMNSQELNEGRRIKSFVDGNVRRVIQTRRIGRIQNLGAIERQLGALSPAGRFASGTPMGQALREAEKHTKGKTRSGLRRIRRSLGF
jgi:hypothetical protein